MRSFKGSLDVILILVIVGGVSKNILADSLITVDSKELKSTVITPHMEAEIKEGQNLIYCSTFQIAWNEFRDICDAHLPKDPEVVELLDKKLTGKEDISKDCYVAMAGRCPEIVDKVNNALKSKFKGEAWIVEEEVKGTVYLIYAFIFKNLMFKKEFESLESPIWFKSNGCTKKVKAFGIEEYRPNVHPTLGKQISILDYKNNSDFIIGLSSKSPNDEIILAKIPLHKTLIEAIKSVEERIKGAKPDVLKEDESLQIPKIEFDVSHSYPEIEAYVNRWIISPLETIQRTCFRLNEKGVVLKSEARMTFYESIKVAPRRRFVFDRPFLIYLKEKGSKYPYFAMWVGNPELLVKTTEEK